MAADIAKSHDDCPQYELEILDGTEELGELRNIKNYGTPLSRNLTLDVMAGTQILGCG